MKNRAKCVEDCLHDAQILREAVEDLSHTQEKAVLRTLGIEDVNSSSDSEAEADESDSEVRFQESVTQFQIPDVPPLVQSHFNWFEIMDINDGCEKDVSEKCFSAVMKLDLSTKEKELLKQS